MKAWSSYGLGLRRLEFADFQILKTGVMPQTDELFEVLYQKYRSAVVAHFLRFGFDRERALDLSQETFLRVYRNMDTWRQEGHWSYLKTTASRIALNELRNAAAVKRSAPLTALGDLPSEPQSKDPNPAEALEVADAERLRHETLRLALAELPSRLRAPLLLRLRGASYKEIAAQLHLTLDAVKSRLHETKNLLRKTVQNAPEKLNEPEEE